jgi:hypothetical protein
MLAQTENWPRLAQRSGENRSQKESKVEVGRGTLATDLSNGASSILKIQQISRARVLRRKEMQLPNLNVSTYTVHCTAGSERVESLYTIIHGPERIERFI